MKIPAVACSQAAPINQPCVEYMYADHVQEYTANVRE